MFKFIRYIFLFLVVFLAVFAGTFYILDKNFQNYTKVQTAPVLNDENNDVRTAIAPDIRFSTGTATPSVESKLSPAKKMIVVAQSSAPTHSVANTPATKASSNSLPIAHLATQPTVITPPQIKISNTSAVLSPESITSAYIFVLTNKERTAHGVTQLAYNNKLAAIAEAKAVDMIQKQYFAHVSPSGVGIGDFATMYGYKYLYVGENLALGIFTSSAAVVDGWMNSEGHRENILSTNFTEIGIAALKGNYEGREVWYVVQEFGRPFPNCEEPDPLLKQKVELYQTQINTLDATLANLKKEIDAFVGNREEYNAKVNDYNTIVALYNQLISIAKGFAETYNAQAEAFNVCMNI